MCVDTTQGQKANGRLDLAKGGRCVWWVWQYTSQQVSIGYTHTSGLHAWARRGGFPISGSTVPFSQRYSRVPRPDAIGCSAIVLPPPS